RGERLLCRALTAVTHDAGGTLDDRPVRQERFDARVRRRRPEPGRIGGGRRGHERHVLAREGVEGRRDQRLVVLVRGRGGHEHDRPLLVGEPSGRLGRRIPGTGTYKAHRRRPVAPVVLVWLRGQGEETVG